MDAQDVPLEATVAIGGLGNGDRHGAANPPSMSAQPPGAAAALPSGTITFAFTDIEGSTQRWDRDRFAMERAVRRHDAILRGAIEAHRGYVFKTIGDAFCAAFSRPEDAIAAMYEAQRTIAAEDFEAVGGLHVRAAIHTGTADERDRDYFGPAVNRVARLLGIAYGGQVLVSGITSGLVRGALPAQISLRSLGEHRLRDLLHPEDVHQLVGPDLAAEFPPLKSLTTLPNNLPRNPTSFVGRDHDIAAIRELIGSHRLVTVAGSGGIGKTRTCLHVAATLLDGSGDGVWFVELASLSNGEYLAAAIAAVLGMTLPSDGEPIEHLVRALAAKRFLLVLDNCEHLVDAVARTVAAILRGCPEVKILASSRQSLGIAGEATFRLPSLEVPVDVAASTLSPADANRYAAIALFVDRAQAVDHRFTLNADNTPMVADICCRLDGIALAIELAASRVKFLSPRQLRDRLSERFRVLTGGNRDVLPRQQTLRAMIDWSHDLLDERDRMLFRRLGVFVNGFTLAGATAVGADDDLDEFEVFDALASLVEKSLVLADTAGDVMRYRFLESTRAYAAEKLRDAGESEPAGRRHLTYFRDRYAQLSADRERTSRNGEITDAFMADLDELRFALDASLSRREVRDGAALLVSLDRLWLIFGLLREGISRIDAFRDALSEDDVVLLARLDAILVSFLYEPMYVARAAGLVPQTIARARAAKDDATLGYALLSCMRVCMIEGWYEEANRYLSEAESIVSASPRLRARLLEERATLSAANGDLDGAVRAYEEIRAHARALGNTRNEMVFSLQLADLRYRRGETSVAIEMLRDILPVLRAGPDSRFFAVAAVMLGRYLVETDDVNGAMMAALDAVAVHGAREPEQSVVTFAIELLALVDAILGHVRRSALLAGYAEAALHRIELKRDALATSTYDRLHAILRQELEPAELARLGVEGAALTAEAAVALASERRVF